LDETYDRILREISKANPDQAYRLLQCLAVATRPLGVDELAEILALNFSETDKGIPALNKGWRWDDERQSVLATCSSLIVIVEDSLKTPVVQFSHFSVKEFLTSDRLSEIKANISRFHIHLEPAHTVITQACLAILLQSDHDNEAKSTSPLSSYAAQHWVDHAQFGNVSLRVEDGMRRLFDPAKSYFIAWLNTHNLDHEWTSFLRDDLYSRQRSGSSKPEIASLGEDDAALCLYYAALCGFRDLTNHFLTSYPQHINASVGFNKSPLVAALHVRHIHVAELLHQHGAVLPIGYEGRTLLHAASNDGLVDIAQWLVHIGADANAQEYDHRTPLQLAAARGHLEIVRILLGHVVDVNVAAGTDNRTPLHEAAGHVGIMRLLIENGADVNARDQRQSTALHHAWSAETAQLLIEHGADINARDESLSTALHLASTSDGNPETAQFLIEHGADVHARSQDQSTALHFASRWNPKTAQSLIEHGADVHARDQDQSTPLHFAWRAETARLLIEHGADVHARDKRQSTPLHLTWCVETAQLLIDHGADVHAQDEGQSTPLHLASSRRNAESVQLLIKHGADVHARDQHQSTPLHFAWRAETARLLIEHGADVHAQDQCLSTPLHLTSSRKRHGATMVLIEHGADINARDQNQSTPLHWASSSIFGTAVDLLIEHGANVNAYDKNHQTPLHRVLSCQHPKAYSVRLLLENGADVDIEDDKGLTPFQIASAGGHHKIAQLLLDHRDRIVSSRM
jgi:ankyrin repeat protein